MSLIPPHLIPPAGRYTAGELANYRAVLEYFELAVNRHDIAAARRYQGDRYIQHDPNVRDGADGLAELSADFVRRYPDMRLDIVRAFVEGDLVVLHVRWVDSPSPHGDVSVDFFRLEEGRVVEHWGVVQPIPAAATAGHPVV